MRKAEIIQQGIIANITTLIIRSGLIIGSWLMDFLALVLAALNCVPQASQKAACLAPLFPHLGQYCLGIFGSFQLAMNSQSLDL